MTQDDVGSLVKLKTEFLFFYRVRTYEGSDRGQQQNIESALKSKNKFCT